MLSTAVARLTESADWTYRDSSRVGISFISGRPAFWHHSSASPPVSLRSACGPPARPPSRPHAFVVPSGSPSFPSPELLLQPSQLLAPPILCALLQRLQAAPLSCCTVGWGKRCPPVRGRSPIWASTSFSRLYAAFSRPVFFFSKRELPP